MNRAVRPGNISNIYSAPACGCLDGRCARHAIHWQCLKKTILTMLVLVLTLGVGWPVFAAPLMQVTGPNLALNGSFEKLNLAGNHFPVGWTAGAAGGTSVTITKTAYSGSLAVEMKATAPVPCLMNSRVIPVREGRVTFWFRALFSTVAGKNLAFYIMGVNAAGVKSAPRVAYVVPAADVGDGRWHKGTLQFDYRNEPEIKGIVLAPRINEDAARGKGTWIVDDVDLRRGRRPADIQVSAFWTPTPLLLVGRPATLGVQITNIGELRSGATTVKLTPPAGTGLAPGFPSVIHIGPLASEQSGRGKWRVTAGRPMNATFHIVAEMAGRTVQATRRILFVSHQSRRYLYTGPHGNWEHYPALKTLQQGDHAPLRPLHFLTSAQLPDSPFGMNCMLPRAHNMETIFAPRFLIDGNPHTYWAGEAQDAAMPGPPDWVVIRLPHSVKVDAVGLTPYWHGQGFPVDFQIAAASKRGPWRTVVNKYAYHLASGKEQQSVTFNFPAVTADRIRLRVTRFSQVPGFYASTSNPFQCRLAEIVVLNTRGHNVALASRGAHVTCSPTWHSFFSDRRNIAKTFPELFKLGIKWIRVGQWGDPTTWSAVERVKGHYAMDPATDAAITECAKRGIHVLCTLDYGNTLYQRTPSDGDPGPLWHQGEPLDGNGGPTTRAARRGFVNYAGWMAKHFKGRIPAYEIWNEENGGAWYSLPPNPVAYGRLLRDAARRIKHIDPQAKVVFGGTVYVAPTYLKTALAQGAGPYLNAVAFHPYGAPKPEGAVGALDAVDGKLVLISAAKLGFHNYDQELAGLRRWIAPYCPKAQLWAGEWAVFAHRQGMAYPGVSELTQAKMLARFYVTNLFYGVHALWWAFYNGDNGDAEWGILRSTDMSRMPAFYTGQAICTTFSGATPDPHVKAQLRTAAPDKTLWTFRGRHGSLLLAAYSAIATVRMKDHAPGVPGTIVIHGMHPHFVEAIDPLYGKSQRLDFTDTAGSVKIRGLIIRNYPLILRIR